MANAFMRQSRAVLKAKCVASKKSESIYVCRMRGEYPTYKAFRSKGNIYDMQTEVTHLSTDTTAMKALAKALLGR